MKKLFILTWIFMLLLIKRSRCLFNIPKQELACLGRVLNDYGTIYSCPWDISNACSAPNIKCHRNNSLCGEREQQFTVVSIIVFLSSYPILKNEKVFTTLCACGRTDFSCYVSLNDTTGIQGSSSAGEIVGALFGGIVLGVLGVILSHFGTKWYRNAKPKHTTRKRELGTANPAYGSTPYTVPVDQQLNSRPRNTSHVYTTINDNTPKVSHVKPIVRYDQEDNATYSETYSHLNESEYKETTDNYDHVRPPGGISKTSMNDSNGMKNNSSAFANPVNEYTEVVGDGFLNHGECHGN
ncbi:uncharacterized protein [Magallana gigas]|uniref:uncharacterized protein isoform X3 n=1 Tax=Magallana gigas TaxID=29159 RepID=UPI00333EC4BC